MYHLFQNSIWKVVKIAKTSDWKSAVTSQTTATVCKSGIFKYNFHTEGGMGRGQALYLQILWNLYFYGVKVSCLRMFAQKSYKALKFG